MVIKAGTILEFIVAWIVSAIIIFVVLKIYPGKQKRENLGGALLAALVGELIFALFNIIRIPFANIIAVLVWLWALRKIFGVSWVGAAIIAFLVYVFSVFVTMLGIPHLI
ncbi:hypothetical protein IG193_07010 [Infirmifilum lucidum]|uniref:Phage holin family protein n=1 Tax=Infirmifilum lucidum TaxID=2776706 RepID=A0A7L9FFB9_9CREN|nr:hypothetical protein [Infirmifilum lucidum]QOJ78498.1 hypothetical protein IG193_07010 [Infirmifilum lucidum]